MHVRRFLIIYEYLDDDSLHNFHLQIIGLFVPKEIISFTGYLFTCI